MLHKEFRKIVLKILIEKDMTLKELSEILGESQQNLSQKLKRESIKLLDVEKILDALDYDIIIKKKDQEKHQ